MNPAKSKAPRRRSSAFTLIELIVTITLIALLATLALVAMNYANTTSKRKKAQAHLATLEGLLAIYNGDNGTYPRPKEGGDSQMVSVGGINYPAGGAVALYQALSADGDSSLEGGEVASKGQAGSVPDGKIYLADLDPNVNTQRMVAQNNALWLLVDPWGAPWRYRVPPRFDPKHPEEFEQHKTEYHNPATYDLSSYGGDYQNEKGWIKNWP